MYLSAEITEAVWQNMFPISHSRRVSRDFFPFTPTRVIEIASVLLGFFFRNVISPCLLNEILRIDFSRLRAVHSYTVIRVIDW